jgi:hypothetical protein
MREDDLKGSEECSEMIKAVLALNAEVDRRTEEIVEIGRRIVLPYFCERSIAFVVAGHTWTISTSEQVPDYVYEVLNKDIGRELPLGSYIGDITEDDWNSYAEDPGVIFHADEEAKRLSSNPDCTWLARGNGNVACVRIAGQRCLSCQAFFGTKP